MLQLHSSQCNLSNPIGVVAEPLHYLELNELAARIRAREISPLDVTRAQLDRIAALDGTLGSYARAMADRADEAMLGRGGAAFQRVTSWHLRHPPV